MSAPTFDDIVWTTDCEDEQCCVSGLVTLANGTTVSVVGGVHVFGGDGVSTFEVAAWDEEGHWIRLAPFDDVLAFCDREQVEDVLRRLSISPA